MYVLPSTSTAVAPRNLLNLLPLVQDLSARLRVCEVMLAGELALDDRDARKTMEQ